MQFQPIIPTKPGDNQISIALTKQGTSITIPGRVAEAARLQGVTRVGLAYGSEGRKRCVRIAAQDDGPFKLTQRRSTFIIISKELNPVRAIEGKKPVTHDITDQGVIITLPADWQVSDSMVGQK
jgi:hypothetical protein